MRYCVRRKAVVRLNTKFEQCLHDGQILRLSNDIRAHEVDHIKLVTLVLCTVLVNLLLLCSLYLGKRESEGTSPHILSVCMEVTALSHRKNIDT
jgi:hypothetical protein